MAYWLMKSEPGAWSWADQAKAGTAEWDGVRNYQAANNMKAMKRGDRAFFYHSVNEKRIVGIVEVAREYYPDPSDASARFGMVDVAAVKPFEKPVTLAEITFEWILRPTRLESSYQPEPGPAHETPMQPLGRRAS